MTHGRSSEHPGQVLFTFDGDAVVVALSGAFDDASAHRLELLLGEIVSSRRLVVQLAQVSSLEPGAAAVLRRFLDDARARHVELGVEGTPPGLRSQLGEDNDPAPA